MNNKEIQYEYGRRVGRKEREQEILENSKQRIVYYCKKCDRFTDVRYISDKQGGRYKSYCYKCSNEILEPVIIIFETELKQKIISSSADLNSLKGVPLKPSSADTHNKQKIKGKGK